MAPVAYDQAPIYYANPDGVFRVSLADRVPAPFGAQEPTTALIPSPSRTRVAQELKAGRVDVYTREGTLLGQFDIRTGLLGWRDEDHLVFFDRVGTDTLHIARIDGTERHDLPNPKARSEALTVSLAPDGRRAVIVMNASPPASNEAFVVATFDGAIVAKLDARDPRNVMWARDGRVLWLEDMGKVLAIASGDTFAVTRTTLVVAACAISAWGGDRFFLYQYVPAGDTYACTDRYLTHDGHDLVPIGGSIHTVIAFSPDNRKIVEDLGIAVFDPDFANLEYIVPDDWAAVLGW